MLIYCIGDSIATIVLGQFQWIRFLGMAFIGASFYAVEIPNYFRWIDTKFSQSNGKSTWVYRTIAAVCYFNPLWIARHMFFIRLFSGNEAFLWSNILWLGLQSFLINIPISLLGNFVIQNKITLKHRFAASALFSALLAIFYALMEQWL